MPFFSITVHTMPATELDTEWEQDFDRDEHPVPSPLYG